MENTEIGYTCRNIYILSKNQAATKAFGSFQINSKLVWEFHQALVKLAEYKRMQLVWVPGDMGIDGNEIAYQIASKTPCIHTQDLSLPCRLCKGCQASDHQGPDE
jgi:ribonuclease HI